MNYCIPGVFILVVFSPFLPTNEKIALVVTYIFQLQSVISHLYLS